MNLRFQIGLALIALAVTLWELAAYLVFVKRMNRKTGEMEPCDDE